ncbi:hypothetical protein H5410_014282 [Solanum commersonii]|uniref:Gag-pol polyprotein n=1 Tax=Solanum commersonii TaxID=4109 RepID=A0A9J5ZQW7_SOLCO|nr:hypothetical protein H5410_014282 [Solanum commersonii]
MLQLWTVKYRIHIRRGRTATEILYEEIKPPIQVIKIGLTKDMIIPEDIGQQEEICKIEIPSFYANKRIIGISTIIQELANNYLNGNAIWSYYARDQLMIYSNSRELRKANIDEVQRWILSLLKPEERPTTQALKEGFISAELLNRYCKLIGHKYPDHMFLPPRRAVRVRPTMKSVEEELPSALEVQTQEEIKYVDFCEVIQMIRELLRMNPPSFTGSSISENPENFIEELKRVFDVMHVSELERSSLMGRFFPRELYEAKIKEFLTLNTESMSVHEYSLSQARRQGSYDLARFMIHLQQVEEDKLKDREEFKDERAKIVGDEFRQQKNDANQSSLPQKQKGPAPPSASALAPENKDGYNRNSYSFRARLAYPQGSMVPRGSKTPACARCGRTHLEGHFMKECPKNMQGSGNLSNRAQASSVAPPDRMVPRGATSSTCGGANHPYAINSRQEQENSPDVVTGMIRVFDFAVYALLDL